VIASGGSITLNQQNGSTAVTVNSNNTLTNNGTINITDSNNASGVRIAPGVTGSYSGTGVISVTEDYTRTDTDNDGDLDGPMAIGTGRVGLLLDSGGAFTGNILLDRSSTVASAITVEGNNSAGVSLRSQLNGNYVQNGNVTIIGSNSVGVDIRENVTGNVEIGGSASAQGEGSVAVRVLGNVAGEFLIDGAVSSTGYTNRDASNYEDPDDADDNDTGNDEPDKLDADDLLIGGAAVEIRGDLARGLLVNGTAVGTADPTPDVKDVVQNFNENRTAGTVVSYGSAPAILIQSLDGAAGDTIQLGRVRETIYDSLDDDKDNNTTEVIGVFNYDYGFMNRGTIVGLGLNMGVSATGAKIAGSADGQHATIIDGGIMNGGVITARAFEANAVGLHIGSGASTPVLVNSGSILGTVNTETNHTGQAVRIDAGANVPTVTNSGLMQANVRGYDGNPIAFQDLSGTVTTFTNSSRIAAGYTDDDTSDDITSGAGRAIALDLSHRNGSVTLTQNDTIDNARIFGDVLFGVGNDTFNLLSGEMIGDVEFGAGADTFNITSARLFGNAEFDGSTAAFTMTDSQMVGNLDFGATGGSMSFLANSRFFGEITRTGAAPLSMTVNNAEVNNYADGTLNLSSMTLANSAKIGLVIDNARIAGNTPIYNISGTANIAANTVFTPIFAQFTTDPFTLRVVNAGTLNLGGPLSGMLNSNGPYLYNMALVQPNPNAIDLQLSVKSSSQLGLNGRQAGAYNAVLDLLTEEDEFAVALTSIAGSQEFLRSWGDLLPGSDASVMRVLASNATAAFGATAHRLDLISNKPDAPGGAWAEEFGVYHTSDPTADSVEVSGGGFGVAAGVDLISTGTALIGVFTALESVEMEEENRTFAPLNVSQTSIGAYGGWIEGPLAVNGAASFGFVDFTSDRRVDFGEISDRFRGEWTGQTYTAAIRASYNMPLGWFDARPFIAADYIGFQQDGYTETAAERDALAIVAGDSDASMATASYGIMLESVLGADEAFAFRPHLSLGYRNVLNWESTPATMNFVGGSSGTTFTLASGVEPEDALVAGLGLNVDSQFVNIRVGYDAEVSENAMTHYGSITLRMAFW
jgi:uncharacterized protein with beta-barrel porin domain